jgi:hypothetical protein
MCAHCVACPRPPAGPNCVHRPAPVVAAGRAPRRRTPAPRAGRRRAAPRSTADAEGAATTPRRLPARRPPRPSPAPIRHPSLMATGPVVGGDLEQALERVGVPQLRPRHNRRRPLDQHRRRTARRRRSRPPLHLRRRARGQPTRPRAVLHRAIEGEALGGVGPGVSPRTALAVGLKVDSAALPDDLKQDLAAGRVNIDDPATTLALLRLNAVVGLKGFFHSEGTLSSVGITCASCHSIVDDSFAPGIGRRLDG